MVKKEQSRAEATSAPKGRKKSALTVREMTTFAMLGATMYCLKLLLAWAPNIHLTALFIIAITVVWRTKALIPVYIFVMLTGLFDGISAWWVPYLYAWALLWGGVMLLPRRMPKRVAAVAYVVLGTLHGLLFGVLCAPSQALFWGLDFNGTLAWIAQGLYFDILHAAGNFAACTLVLPLISLFKHLKKQ